MRSFTIAINANFHLNIRIYFLPCDNKLVRAKEALSTFISETMNMYDIGKEPLIKEVDNIDSLECLTLFLKNNSINCTIQETDLIFYEYT